MVVSAECRHKDYFSELVAQRLLLPLEAVVKLFFLPVARFLLGGIALAHFGVVRLALLLPGQACLVGFAL
jgi:hypothetical protein